MNLRAIGAKLVGRACVYCTTVFASVNKHAREREDMVKSNKGQSQDYTAGYRAGVKDSSAPGRTWAVVIAVIGLLMAGAFLMWFFIGLGWGG